MKFAVNVVLCILSKFILDHLKILFLVYLIVFKIIFTATSLISGRSCDNMSINIHRQRTRYNVSNFNTRMFLAWVKKAGFRIYGL